MIYKCHTIPSLKTICCLLHFRARRGVYYYEAQPSYFTGEETEALRGQMFKVTHIPGDRACPRMSTTTSEILPLPVFSKSHFFPLLSLPPFKASNIA